MTLEEIITTRRSVRSFTDEPISKEAILKLLDRARWAPYVSECWRFVVVREVEGKEGLAQGAPEAFAGWAATDCYLRSGWEICRQYAALEKKLEKSDRYDL